MALSHKQRQARPNKWSSVLLQLTSRLHLHHKHAISEQNRFFFSPVNTRWSCPQPFNKCTCSISPSETWNHYLAILIALFCHEINILLAICETHKPRKAFRWSHALYNSLLKLKSNKTNYWRGRMSILNDAAKMMQPKFEPNILYKT